jgi:1-acyl-sn-glycerol-3-phosphate acyltransferase
MKILKRLYTAYGIVVFIVVFFLLFPFFLIPIFFPKQFKLIGIINRWWGWLVLPLLGIPFSMEYRAKLDPKKQYIFCPNHFSYFDIATMVLNKHNTIFVGKNDMERIPMFGFMYSKLHITVDRANLKSRYSTVVRSREALDEGKSLVIFPEGGIVTLKEPVMSRFKDGPFRISIEKQIAIVPVTIPYNWIILPPIGYPLQWHKMKAIFHEPIDPANYSLENIDQYKQAVFQIMDTELKQHTKHEN